MMEDDSDFSTRHIMREAFVAVCNNNVNKFEDLFPKLDSNIPISFYSSPEYRCGAGLVMITSRCYIKFPPYTVEQLADIIEKGICDHTSEHENNKHLVSFSLLHFACYFGHLEIVKLLVEHGADVCSEAVPFRYTPLQMSIFSKAHKNIIVDIMSLLLANGANPSKNDDIDGQTILHIAVTLGYLPFVELLLKYNLDINAEDHTGTTALYLAVTSENLDIVKILVTNGADVNKGGKKNDAFPLLESVRRGSTDIVTLLLKHNADVNFVGGYFGGDTPLILSVLSGNIELFQELIKFGADVNHCNKTGHAAIHEAAFEGKDEIVDILLNLGCDYDTRTHDGRTPLDLACQRGHNSIALKLMNLGANVKNTDKYLDTPLHHCCNDDRIETFKRLIELGADPTARNCNNLTPLWSAVRTSSRSVVKLLIELNVNLSVASTGYENPQFYEDFYTQPKTPLFMAFNYNTDPFIAAMLIIAGVNLSKEKWLRSPDEDMEDYDSNEDEEFNKSPGSDPHIDLLRSYRESPVSLKRLCRDKIRRRLATRLVDALPSLNLPSLLVDYILIKHDLELCEAGTLDLLRYKFR